MNGKANKSGDETVNVIEPCIRVVMVDDDVQDIILTRALLKRAGAPVTVEGFSSGAELYDYIKNNGIGSIDVILLDINMPREDGFEVLRKLNNYPDIGDVKIVMYSTSKRPHETIMALELGANDFVEKPRRLEDVADLSAAILAANESYSPLMCSA